MKQDGLTEKNLRKMVRKSLLAENIFDPGGEPPADPNNTPPPSDEELTDEELTDEEYERRSDELIAQIKLLADKLSNLKK
jgi:hypothetical protein